MEPTSALHLEGLPAEILTHIFEYLIPEIPDIGETRPVEYAKLIPDEPWYEPTRRRTGLRNSCLVSRTLLSIARPLLYRVIPIVDEIDLPLLLRTFIERIEYGTWTRYLSCHITLTDEPVYKTIWRESAVVMRTLQPQLLLDSPHPAVRILATLVGKKLSPSEFKKVPQMILFAILCLAPKLETLLLQVPFGGISPIISHYFGLSSYIAAPQSHLLAARPLQHLTKLLIQADPEMLEDVEEDAREDGGAQGIIGFAGGHYWPLIASCPKLSSVEAYLDDGDWCPDIKMGRWPQLPAKLENIKCLYLNDSFATPQHVAHLFRHFPCLETLYLEPRWTSENVSWLDPEADPERLDEALERFGKNLRRLDLGWFDCSDCLESIGEDGYLSCLPRLPRLESLSVQLCLLVKMQGFGRPHSLPPLEELLPSTLVELTLEDWWWGGVSAVGTEHDDQQEFRGLTREHYFLDRDYHAALQGALLSLAARSIYRLPNLRRVMFLVRSSVPLDLEEEDSSASEPDDPHLEECMSTVREAFEGIGIQFSTSYI